MESPSLVVEATEAWMNRILSSRNNMEIVEVWIENTTQEMERYQTMLESNHEGTHSAELSFWNTAPCVDPTLAYLTVIPVNFICDASLVRVLHIICDLPTSTPARTVTCGIIGDSKPPLLPIMKLAPWNGLEQYFDPSEAAWPTTERMKKFYKIHGPIELMARDKREEKGDHWIEIPKLVFVPSTWTAAFLEPVPPKVAYERALWMQKLLPRDYIHSKQIAKIVHWLRCACC
jgi:hypothetical protein